MEDWTHAHTAISSAGVVAVLTAVVTAIIRLRKAGRDGQEFINSQNQGIIADLDRRNNLLQKKLDEVQDALIDHKLKYGSMLEENIRLKGELNRWRSTSQDTNTGS